MFSCCGGKGNAVWDIGSDAWKCSDCGSLQSNDPSYLPPGMIGYIPHPTEAQLELFRGKKVKCECGGSKLGTTHAHWCDIKN